MLGNSLEKQVLQWTLNWITHHLAGREYSNPAGTWDIILGTLVTEDFTCGVLEKYPRGGEPTFTNAMIQVLTEKEKMVLTRTVDWLVITKLY